MNTYTITEYFLNTSARKQRIEELKQQKTNARVKGMRSNFSIHPNRVVDYPGPEKSNPDPTYTITFNRLFVMEMELTDET